MVFSSILFIFRFMPIAFLLYYITPKKFKNFVLLILSLVFYSWGEFRYFPIMMASIVGNYLIGQGIKRKKDNKSLCKTLLIISIVFNLGMLAFFKYSNFFITNINGLLGTVIPLLNIALPLGISFYTFQTMSYTIDVYRGKVEAEDNIITFGAFVALFPQLIAGPIVKYNEINEALKSRTITLPQIEEGIFLFVMGMGSKVLIANNVGLLWDEVVRLGFTEVSSALAWLGVLAYSFQIYFDFSGYSLMAIGLGKMLGFNFPANFNYPYISKSATEFWRRWHITLGSWFREYLYIPLGGNRVSKVRFIFNTAVVWFCTGFWHGANWNFIFWGMYFFALLMLEKNFLLKYLEKSKVWSRIYLLTAVMISWAIFAVTDLGQLGNLFTTMFSFRGGSDWGYYLKGYITTFIFAAVFSTPVIKKWYERIKHITIVRILLIGFVFTLSVAYLVDATYNPFLYFRF
ncbi:MAG: MBOAT family O-acyltransferase [Oscillospiraceae bacterium]